MSRKPTNDEVIAKAQALMDELRQLQEAKSRHPPAVGWPHQCNAPPSGRASSMSNGGAVGPLFSEEGDVGPGRELVQGIFGLELGQRDADANADSVLHGPIDQREALDHLLKVDTRDTGDKLVTAEANHKVESAQIGTHAKDDGLQDAIARAVTVTVIHDFQVIDVHERDNELPVYPPSSLDLVTRQVPPMDRRYAPVASSSVPGEARPAAASVLEPLPLGPAPLVAEQQRLETRRRSFFATSVAISDRASSRSPAVRRGRLRWRPVAMPSHRAAALWSLCRNDCPCAAPCPLVERSALSDTPRPPQDSRYRYGLDPHSLDHYPKPPDPRRHRHLAFRCGLDGVRKRLVGIGGCLIRVGRGANAGVRTAHIEPDSCACSPCARCCRTNSHRPLTTADGDGVGLEAAAQARRPLGRFQFTARAQIGTSAELHPGVGTSDGVRRPHPSRDVRRGVIRSAPGSPQIRPRLLAAHRGPAPRFAPW